MHKNHILAQIILFSFIFFLAACSQPAAVQPATSTIFPPVVTSTPATVTLAPTSLPSEIATQLPTAIAHPTDTAQPTATTQPTEKPTATPAPSATPKPSVRGFAIFDMTKSEVRGYDLNSHAALFTYPVPGEKFMAAGTSQIVGETLFYYSHDQKAVLELTKGTSTTLNFLPKDPSIDFSVSPDGKQIAWSIDIYDTQNPGSELWVAAIDGSGAKKIASIDPAANSKWLVLDPYKWLPDGRLLYVQSPTGIGGYILFGGFAGIFIYNPSDAANSISPLLDAAKPGAGSLCLQEISPDLKNVVTNCGTKTPGTIDLMELSSGKITIIKSLPEQGTAGGALYSPSGEWLAYSAARNEPDNEAGKAAIIPAAGGEPQVIASFGNGFVRVADWIDENSLLLESHQSEQPTIWVIQRDGSGLLKVGEGSYMGAIK